MKIKIQLLLVFLCFTTAIFSQEPGFSIKQKVYKKQELFTKHGITLQQYDFESQAINLKITESLKWSRKKETYAVVGVVSLIGGLAGMALAFKEFDSVGLFEAGVGLSALALPSFIFSGIKGRKAKKSFAELRALMVQ